MKSAFPRRSFVIGAVTAASVTSLLPQVTRVFRMAIVRRARRYVLTVAILGVIAGLVAPLVPAAAVAQSSRDEREAAEQAIHISELESRGRFSSIYNLMHSDSKAISPREAVVGWYETDFAPLEPQSITEILEVRFITWTWDVTGDRYRNTAEVDYVQPFGSGSDVTYVEETVRLVEEDSEWRWFFGRSRKFVDEQIARFVDDDATQQRDTDDDEEESASSEDGLPGSTQDCTLVELYPGYPDYRGNITGVMPHWSGIGDYLCLQDLESSDPSFDRADEDRANRQAAQRLGINGTFEDWTWENWMLIEVERGLPASCYTCLMDDSSAEPYNPDIRPDPDDPRILLGFVGTTVAADRITSEFGVTVSHTFEDDYELRAVAAFSAGSPVLNAAEMLDAMETFMGQWFSSTGGTSLDPHGWGDVWLSWGGYTYSMEDMSPEDQEFVAIFGVRAVTKGHTDSSRSMIMAHFEDLLGGWRTSGRQDGLAEYLREHWKLSF